MSRRKKDFVIQFKVKGTGEVRYVSYLFHQPLKTAALYTICHEKDINRAQLFTMSHFKANKIDHKVIEQKLVEHHGAEAGSIEHIYPATISQQIS